MHFMCSKGNASEKNVHNNSVALGSNRLLLRVTNQEFPHCDMRLVGLDAVRAEAIT